jgi:hypothetical protein
MSGRVKIILGLVAVAVLVWFGRAPVKAIYFNRRADLQKNIVSLTGDIERYRDAAQDHVLVEDRIRGYVNRTMGGDLETVDHRLRSRLNRIGEEIGLGALSVGTGRVRQLETPAKGQFSRRSMQQLRQEIDFVEVEAWISGQGPLENVLRLIHRIDAEPWLKRVQQVRLQPKDNGRSFAVSLRLVTLYLPDRDPVEPPPLADDPEGFGRYASMVRRNPFQVPPPAPEAPPRPEAPAGNAASDLAQWVLTGVASSRGSVEVWLLNRGSGETRRLAVGETFQELVLEAADGDVAEFRRGDERVRVAVGSRLVDGVPVGNE